MNFSWGAVLFGALAAILISGGAMCAYESYAIETGNTPTISRIVAYQFAQNPHLYMIGIFLAGVILGALIVHFTNWAAV